MPIFLLISLCAQIVAVATFPQVLITKSQWETRCPCPLEYHPVCGSEGKVRTTFRNKCMFQCFQQLNSAWQLAFEDECHSRLYAVDKEVQCICAVDPNLVCGANGVTYPNLCSLECYKHIWIRHGGPCKQPPNPEGRNDWMMLEYHQNRDNVLDLLE